MRINRNEIVFYVSAGIVTFINMMAVPSGYVIFTLIPSLLILWWLGYKLFPTP
ncbi:MAG: hypothetical protein HY863_14475 [Chloroflexi bacterium]|nr:hypothetical protein [Chloroflexota bacterium]